MPFLRVTCPSCSTDLKVPPEAAGKRVRCSACKAVTTVPAEESCEKPAVNYVANFADEPPPIRRRSSLPALERPEDETPEAWEQPEETSRQPRGVVLLVGGVAAVVAGLCLASFARVGPAGSGETAIASRAIPRDEFRRLAEDNVKAGNVDWSRVGSTASVDDLTFAITETGLNHDYGTPMSMTVVLQATNASRTRIYRSEAPEYAKLIDEHGNLYKCQRYTGWMTTGDVLHPGGSVTQYIFFEFPIEVSRRFRLTLGKTAFELSGDVRLTFERPTAKYMNSELRPRR